MIRKWSEYEEDYNKMTRILRKQQNTHQLPIVNDDPADAERVVVELDAALKKSNEKEIQEKLRKLRWFGWVAVSS